MKKELFLLLVILFCTNLLSLNGFGGITQKLCYYPLLGFMMIYTLVHRDVISRNTFGRILKLMILCSLLSAIPCYILFGQSIMDSVKAMIPFSLALICYWFMLCYKPTEQQVIKVFTIVAFAIFALQFTQQFFPNQAMFGVRELEYTNKVLEQRNGIYRFRIGNNCVFTFPILFLAWVRILRKRDISQFVTFVIMFLSVYLTLTRQVIASALVTLFLGVYLFKLRPNKLIMFFMYVLVATVLILNFNSVFGTFFEQSSAELDSDNYIRFLSGEYFLEESLKSPLVFLFGHGVPSGGSAYDLFINKLGDIGYYTSDVGAIGAAYEFGYIYTFLFYVLVFYILIRYRKVIPSYLQMSVLAMTIYSIMIFSILQAAGVIAWSMILYLCELHIRRSPLRMNDTKI